MRGSSTTPSIFTWFDSGIVTPEMFTETWLDNDWDRWLAAKSMSREEQVHKTAEMQIYHFATVWH